MAVKTKRFDPADDLTTDEALAEYINAALETGDPAFIADSLGIVGTHQGHGKSGAPSRPRPREPLQGAVRRRQPGVRDRAQGGGRAWTTADRGSRPAKRRPASQAGGLKPIAALGLRSQY